MTKTQQAYRVYRDKWDAICDEYEAAAKAEFEVGTLVSYDHGGNAINGVVIESPRGVMARASIQNVKTKNNRWIEAHLLSLRD